MKITSFGAAEDVTGSKHLVEAGSSKVLLDCGMFQGSRQEADAKNRRLGFDPLSLHSVVLSHAHIDHSGLLPLLAKKGYDNAVYCTPATRDLCAVMLMDSAHIQRRDAEWLSKKNMTFMPPLYHSEDVDAIMRRLVSVPYEMPMVVAPGITSTFQNAGHVLGSAMVDLACKVNGTTKRVLYTGDIGRRKMPILRDPWEPKEADLVMMEATYGDRDHGPIEGIDAKLSAIVNDTVERGGKIIIPSFALERAQEVIYTLKRLELSEAIPSIPVFVDSPLTVNVTEVFRLHMGEFDEQFKALMDEAGDPFQLRNIRYIRAVQQSMEINEHKGPAIIISAAGMCEHGRILHHLRNHCSDARNAILIIGFQAKNTLGRRIVERQRHIKILGLKHELNAKVHVMNEFSAHAGRTDLIDFALTFKDKAEQVLLVHGEPKAMDSLKKALAERGMTNVHIQVEGEPYEA